MEKSSKIFTSYRALGLVSNDIPLVVRYIKRRKENLIVTVIGNSFHTYGERKLRLLSVGNPLTNPITCVSADTYHVYTAVDSTIYAWRRSTELMHTYPGHSGSVKLIIPFGPHIISVDNKNILYVWDVKSEEIYQKKEFPDNFEISCIMHPATYINKILIGSKQGKLELWNINSEKRIYSFEGWGSEVHVLEQAPAQDVVAIGLDNGEIYLHNLKVDKTLFSFKQEWGPVTTISFRTDGPPVMVSGSTLGHIAIWDLQERRLASQIWKAHQKSVTGLKCLKDSPKMVTSSPDNTLKEWIFDMSDGGARLLIIRDGHSAPPLAARFHGSLGENILSGGEDSSLRMFSTVSDLLNKSFGVASFNKKAAKRSSEKRERHKMPPIVALTSETTQEKPWDNIVCIHRNCRIVSTWSFDKQKLNENKLQEKKIRSKEYVKAYASSMALSFCGNYIIIGFSSGNLDKYNIQSGIYQGSYGSPDTAHEDTVSGVVCDGLNQRVISGDLSGTLKCWEFRKLKQLNKLNFDCGISALHLNRDSGLLSVVMEDWSIQVIDFDTAKVVRLLTGHTNQITDTVFSPNSKWLVSSSWDGSIRTWDLPSGCCVDIFCVPSPASSIALSPTGEFLATVHTGHLGIYLWANRSCFQHVSLSPLSESFIPPVVPLPSVSIDEGRMPLAEGEDDWEEEEEEMDIIVEEYASPEQISKDLITLALLPTSRWLNLLNIDTIRRRNKPKEPIKVPKSAPFFIPTVPGLEFKFQEKTLDTEEGSSRVRNVSIFSSLTPFGEMLNEKKYEEAMKMLMNMGPSAIDVEIRELDPFTSGSDKLLLNFLRMIKYCLSNKKYFEVAEGYLSLYLKIHSDYVLENEEIQELCQKLLNCERESWHSIKNSLNKSLSLISYFKNSAVINY
ncbi:WD repeat-containing protein 36 [Armadillidium nasatum]|uniref:WD repeat-containing protein 36 n=1 Tax=Armadillidium nasatum TaxID=96803 RepID=A0A5N5THX7_9CRUS|nr:WD repeat-containing protein 36 [Armadillidium nasatum]